MRLSPDSSSEKTGVERRRRRWPWILLAVLVVLLLAGGLVLRNAPSLLERQLSASLGAEVTIGRVEIGRRHLTLYDLRVREPRRWPYLLQVDIPRLDLYGPLRRMLELRFERADVASVGALLREPCSEQPELLIRESRLVVDRLLQKGGELRVANREDNRLSFHSVLAGLEPESAPTGTIQASGAEVEPADLLRLLRPELCAPGTGDDPAVPVARLPALRGVEATLTLADSGVMTAELNADSLIAALEGRRLQVPSIGLLASVRPRREAQAVELRLDTPLFRDLQAAALWGPGGEVQIERLELDRLDVGRALAAVEPSLELEASGTLSLHYRAEAAGDALVSEAELSTLSYPGFGGLDIVALRLQVEASAFDPAALRLEAPSVEITAGRVEVGGAASLTVERLALAASAASLDKSGGDGRLRASARLRRGPAAPPPPALGANIEQGTAEIAGDWSLQASGGSWRFTGEAGIEGPDLPRLRLTGTVESADGSPGLDVRWSAQEAPLAQWAALTGTDLSSTLGVEELAGRLRPAGSVTGSLQRPQIHARLQLLDATLDFADGENPFAPAHIALQPEAEVQARMADGRLTLESPPQKVELTTTDGHLLTIELGQRSTWDLQDRSPVMLDVEARSRLGSLALRGREDDRGGFDLALRDVEVDALAAWLASGESPITLPLPAGFTITGELSADLGLDRPAEEGPWEVQGPLHLRGGGAASEDGSRIINGLRGDWQVALRLDEQPDLRLDGRLSGSQLLWDTLYADYENVEVVTRARVGQAREGSGWDGRLEVDLGSARLDLRAQSAGASAAAPPSTDDLSWQLRFHVPDLGALVDQYLKRPFEGIGPVERVEIAGTLDASLSGTSGEQARELIGEVIVTDLDLEAEGMSASGLQATVPVSLRWNEDGQVEAAGPPQRGRLAFRELVIRGLEVAGTSTPIGSSGDELRLQEPFEIPFAGGRLELSSLRLGDLLSSDRYMQASLRVDGVDLEELTTSLGVFPLVGRMDLSIPTARLSLSGLQTEGVATASVFGGTLRLREISGSELTSRFPQLRFDAEIEGFRLSELTQTFGFGSMSGVLDGALDNVELFAGTPVRLRGWMHTRKSAGVAQRISLKAVNSLTELSAGGSLPGNSLILRLFDNFPYESFAVGLVLAQDHFLIRGLERRGDRELLLKGKLPFRLDIVNRTPGRTVSWSTMLERIRNLELAEVSTGRGASPPGYTEDPETRETPTQP